MTIVGAARARTVPATVALVETATQLLNVTEWAHSTGAVADVAVIVLAPRDRQSVRQLDRVAELASRSGLDVGIEPVRGSGPAAFGAGWQVARGIARARQLVIGDPFSRYVQTLLPLASADRIVVVDDGTAIWQFVSCLDARRPLVRWQLPPHGSEHRARRATRLLSPSARRRLTMFSCLPGATPAGATRLHNRYAWARSSGTPTVVDDRVDVLGSALVDSAVIERRAYTAAVADLVREQAPVRYLAHRRESDNLLAEIATLPGVSVVRPPLPAELFLRTGTVARTVITFPSTVTRTLPVVLGDLGVRVAVRPVEAAWFTPSTTPHARRFVAAIASRAGEATTAPR